MRKQILNINVMIVYTFLILFVGCTQRMNRMVERPAGRGYHAMAYDRESKRVILYGGQTGNISEHPEIFTSSETWAFDLARNRWQMMSPESSPPAMSAHAMAYDSESDRVILHGGGGIFEMERLEDYVLNQTWAYDFNNNKWMRMSDGPPRLGHRMAYDAESDRIVMFSGACFRDGRFQDVQETWVYDFNSDTWTEMKPDRSPAARHYYGLVYDTESDRVILWGGFIGKDVLDTKIWTYDFNTNTWLERTNTRLELIPESGPDPRWYQAMAYDEASDKIIVYGGADMGSDEMWAYGPSGNGWTKLRPSINPGKISRMPMVYVPDAGKLVLFGGQLDSRQYTYSDATWLYDFNNDSWTDVTIRHGEYFGQSKPGIMPEVFALGIISTDKNEHGSVVFTSDLQEAYWTPIFFDPPRTTILFSQNKNGMWTEPNPVWFSDKYIDGVPAITKDSRRMYFTSFRPAHQDTSSKNRNIWFSERINNTWSEPILAGDGISSGYEGMQVSVSDDGTLFFISARNNDPGKVESYHIYYSERGNGKHTFPVSMEHPIKSEYGEHDPYIAPDKSYLIFAAIRPDGFGDADLYISFRTQENSWTVPANLGKNINTENREFSPNVSPDGKYLFFVRDFGGENGDIYWVDVCVIDGLRPKELKHPGKLN